MIELYRAQKLTQEFAMKHNRKATIEIEILFEPNGDCFLSHCFNAEETETAKGICFWEKDWSSLSELIEDLI